MREAENEEQMVEKIPWWGWTLIVIALIGIAYLKLTYLF